MLRSSLEMDNFDVDGQIKLFNWAPEQLLNDEFEKYFWRFSIKYLWGNIDKVTTTVKLSFLYWIKSS